MESPPRRRWLLLVATRAPYYLGVPISVLAFPSVIPWVLLCWIVTFLAQVHLQKPRASVSLCIAVAILLVKGADSGPSSFVLGSMLCLGGIPWPQRWMERLASPRTRAASAAVLLLAPWGCFAWVWSDVHRSAPLILREGRPIVVIGDSLSVHGWPRRLAGVVSVPLVDHSEGGINTVEGLAKLPRALALQPQLVILELGGHDYLEKRGRDATRANLARMIEQCRSAGAEVLLFEIPRGFVMDTYRAPERALAREHDFELVTDGAIRQLVLFSPFTPLGSITGRKLSDDGLHPNDAGHRFLAERVTESLVRLYGPSILAGPR